LHDVIVLADDHMRAILLKPAAWNDHGGEAVLDRGPYLDPGEVGNFDLWRQRRGQRQLDRHAGGDQQYERAQRQLPKQRRQPESAARYEIVH
jgi:hypothetical protein